MNKQTMKTVALTSTFWVLVAGVVVLVGFTAKSNYERGLNAGYAKAIQLQQGK